MNKDDTLIKMNECADWMDKQIIRHAYKIKIKNTLKLYEFILKVNYIKNFLNYIINNSTNINHREYSKYLMSCFDENAVFYKNANIKNIRILKIKKMKENEKKQFNNISSR